MQANCIKAFTGIGAEQRAERVGHWLKSLMGVVESRAWCAEKGVPLKKATGESGNTIGGFLVPADFDAAIMAVRDAVGAFRNAEVRPSRTDNLVRPRRAGGLTANFIAEGQPIPESSLQFDAVGVTLQKLAILARSSQDLWEDSASDLAEYLAAEIGFAFAMREDDAGFNGDGTSAYARIQGLGARLAGTKSAITAPAGHNTFANIDTTDISNLMGGVLATAIPGARWYTSALGYAQVFCRLAGNSGGLVSRTLPDGTIQASFMGFPVEFSAKLPNVQSSLSGQPMLYFGNLKQSSVLVESKSGTVMAVSADRAIDTDQVLIRGVRRIDIVNHSTGDVNSYAPIAMLVGG